MPLNNQPQDVIRLLKPYAPHGLIVTFQSVAHLLEDIFPQMSGVDTPGEKKSLFRPTDPSPPTDATE